MYENVFASEMAPIKHPWTLLDIAAGNRGSTPLASKWFIIRYLHKMCRPGLKRIPRYPGISACIQGKLDGPQRRVVLDFARHKPPGSRFDSPRLQVTQMAVKTNNMKSPISGIFFASGNGQKHKGTTRENL